MTEALQLSISMHKYNTKLSHYTCASVNIYKPYLCVCKLISVVCAFSFPLKVMRHGITAELQMGPLDLSLEAVSVNNARH